MTTVTYGEPIIDIYGFCWVCRAPRCIKTTVAEGGTLVEMMVCSADESHDQG